MSFKDVVFKPIGYVKTEAVGDEVKDKNRIAQIVLKNDLVKGLEGLSDFSHLFVLFYLNEYAAKQVALKVHPRGRMDMPLVGVYATRTGTRPNPIGLTVVELLKVEGNMLTVRGLDAYDGTPVLDIKPYDKWDAIKDIRVPEWRIKIDKDRNRH